MKIRRNCITFYNDNGFKDFTILSDSLYTVSDNRVGLKIKIDEGKQYFLRNVDWVGNSVYRKEDLSRVFNVKKGSVYNQSLIDDRLNGICRCPGCCKQSVSGSWLSVFTTHTC